MATLNEILYQAVDGSFAVDANQRIIYWDSGCEELLGISEQWVLGRPCYSVLNGCNAVTDQAFCNKKCGVASLATGGKAPRSFMLKVKDGKGEPLNLTVNILLVPSFLKKSWHVMHLLHKSSYPDVLSLLDYNRYKQDRKTDKSLQFYDNKAPEIPMSRLSRREHQVLELMSEGISAAIISKKLNISITTVRNHTQHIQNKLGVHSKTAAVAYAYRHHFV